MVPLLAGVSASDGFLRWLVEQDVSQGRKARSRLWGGDIDFLFLFFQKRNFQGSMCVILSGPEHSYHSEIIKFSHKQGLTGLDAAVIFC